MIDWYDKKGKKLTDYSKIEELLRKPDYKIVARTELKNGNIVSTVWLGLDHSFGNAFGDGKPVIFETMVFPKEGDWSELACQRYCTESEAKKGHKELVKEYDS